MGKASTPLLSPAHERRTMGEVVRANKTGNRLVSYAI
jgi:hypothetical protein